MKNLINNKKFRNTLIVLTLLILLMLIVLIYIFSKKDKIAYNGEIARSMAYEQVKDGDEDIDGTDYVKFDAFFLRDLDGDGYAESIRGSSRKIGESDTLYMELNVLTNGYLEDAVIEINNDNFYFQTAIPKDNEVKENAIGNNIKQIKLNTINNGTQRLLTGMVRSGDYNYTNTKASAIGNDINKYSNNMYSANRNSITLTGTHVEIVKDSDGNDVEKRTPIEKTVYFDIDWHGTTRTQIPNYLAGERNLNQIDILDNVINEENNTITFTYNIGIQEIDNMLILSKAHIETEIPDFEGYVPTKVEVIGTNTTYNYNEETRKLVAERQAEINEDGTIKSQAYDGTYSGARYNKFKVEITYPLEAYEKLGSSDIERQLLVNAYYEGFNNQSEEFTNPYKSNTIKANFTLNIDNTFGSVAKLDIFLGKYVYTPTRRYMVSKDKVLNIYNEIASTEDEDLYEVRWRTATGEDGNGTGWVIKEDKAEGNQRSDEFLKLDGTSVSMENITTNIGIYFSNPSAMLGDDGWIKVYDDETDELIETFTKDNWSKYSSSNPYTYKEYIKHIRIETSETYKNAIMHIYNIKKLDDEYIVNTFSKEEFDNLTQIRTIANAYFNGSYFETCTSRADYEAPYSKADITLSSSSISTQETYKNMKITINANANQNVNQIEWLNSAFLLKLPKDLLDIEINSVLSNNDNVKIVSYEQYIENGEKFIKINTENSEPTTFEINIDCNITPDPRIATKTDNIILYSYNENAVEYWKYEKEKDIYDINDNLNKDEIIGKTSKSINLVSPSSILTNEVVSNYDDIGSITVSPQIAIISKEQRTANINLEIKNNYTSTISEVCILGRVPYENNNYTINGNPMESEFTATMQSTMILPEELREKAIVYYSENGEATRDLADSANGWTTNPTDFSKIKSYMIDLCDYVLAREETKQFTYTVSIPENLNYNQVSYSHHGVYFTLDTAEGKYKTKTEPNKVGLMIGKKYNLELTKYQIGKDKLIPGATYSIIEEGQEEGKTRVTGIDGKLIITDLLIEKTYIVKEIKSPAEYELNSSEIKFTTTEENGQLKVTLIDGNVKKIQTVQPDTENGYRVQLEVEDEVKAGLKIIKIEEGSSTPIKGVRFKITGEGLPETGRIITTNTNGEASLEGLLIGTEYTLEETKAEGYYLGNPIKFVISNTLGVYSVSIVEGNVKDKTISVVDDTPIASLTIENEKISRYNLQINKVEKGETKPLAGAKFRLFKGTKKIDDYITDENGIITINNLYQYESNKNIDQTYTLKEIEAPEGYVAVKDITFKVENIEGLLTMEVLEGNIKDQITDGNTVTITIEDSPSFKLIKKDGETGELLPNTKFAIYNVDNGTDDIALDSKNNIVGTKEIINGKEYYTLTTNENGEITADLREGLYKVIEIQTSHEKYELTNDIYYFGIGASRETKTRWVPTSTMSITAMGSYNELLDITNTSDGGFVALIRAYDSDLFFNGVAYHVNDDALAKFGSSGELEWVTSAPPNSLGDIVISSTDNGEIMVITGDNTRGGIATKYNINGEIEWTNSTFSKGAGYINYAITTTDGGCIADFCGRDASVTIGNEQLIISKNDELIVKYTSNGEVAWAKVIDGTINSIERTNDGGCIVCAYFTSGQIKIGEQEITNNGKKDGIIIKYKSDGSVEWVNSIGGQEDDEIEYVAQLNNGGYIVSGYFKSNNITCGDYTLTSDGTSTGILIKYNNDGNVEYTTSFGTETYMKDIIETMDGGYVVYGAFSYTIEIDGYTLLNDTDFMNGMIIKYNENDEVEWVKKIEGVSTGSWGDKIVEVKEGNYILFDDGGTIGIDGHFVADNPGFMEFDKDGNIIGTAASCQYSSNSWRTDWSVVLGDGSIILVEEYWDSFMVGDQIINYEDGMSDSVVMTKYEKIETGNPITTSFSSVGEGGEDSLSTIVSTKDGGYIVGGNFSSANINIGVNSLNNHGEFDGMIIKYSSLGEVEWLTSIGGEKDDRITSIIQTNDNGYLVGGYFMSPNIILGKNVLTNNSNSSNGMIIKYNSLGEVEWVDSIEGSGSNQIMSLTITEDGDFIVGGSFSSNIIRINEKTIINNGENDGILIKYNKNGEVEWSTSIGGEKNDGIKTVAKTSDGGFIAGGYFSSDSIKLGENVLVNKGKNDGVIIKYSKNGEVEWATSIGEIEDDCINSVVEASDGGYVIGINIGKYDPYGEEFRENFWQENAIYDEIQDGVLIKYGKNGEKEWETSIRGEKSESINSIVLTNDGGYLVGGNFDSIYSQVEEYPFGKQYVLGNRNYYNRAEKYIDNYYNDAYVVKYNSLGIVEWTKTIGGKNVNEENNDYIYSVAQLNDGRFIVGGSFQSNTVKADEITINNNGGYDGMLAIIKNYVGVNEKTELNIDNDIKEFNITTEVKKVANVKGGSISGEIQEPLKEPYEKVKYGGNSTKEIVMTPNDGYEIASITVNGEEYPFVANSDGTYIMPQFTNMLENKHVVVTYALTSSLLNIKKIDSQTNEPLEGTQFKIVPVGEELDRQELMGELVDNGDIYDTTINEITDEDIGVQGELSRKQEYYFVKNEDGTYTPNNQGADSTTANSYIPIDLTGKEGTYVVVINAQISSEGGCDYGYATINQSTTAPTYNTSTGRFMYISGTKSASDYMSSVLEGGKKYYLHLGYRKDGSINIGEDQVVINSIKVCQAADNTKEVSNTLGELNRIPQYYFIKNEDGTYVPNNKGVSNTTANSYIPIDLTEKEGTYIVVVNARVSSQKNYDYGYATINQSTTAPAYNTSTGRFMYISGTADDVTTSKDYTSMILDGGKKYYLHLGYRKNGSTNTGEDQVVINSIKVCQADVTYFRYNFIEENGEYKSTNQGTTSTTASSYIPIDLRGYVGEYTLSADAKISCHQNSSGFLTVTNTKVAPSYSNSKGRFCYIKGEVDTKTYTTTLTGNQLYYLHLGYFKNGSSSAGEDTFTVSNIKLTLSSKIKVVETDNNGETSSELPFGQYTIEETREPEGYIKLKDSIKINFDSNGCTLISNPNAEIVTTDGNNITIVNIKQSKVIVRHYLKDRYGNITEIEVAEGEELEGKYGENYTTIPHLDLDKYELEKDETGEYVIPEKATGTFTDGEIKVTYYYVEKQIPLTVHHYIEGTTIPVPLIDGTEAQDEKDSGYENEEYTTKSISNEQLSNEYELVEIPNNSEGIYTGNEIEVTYFYKKIERKVIIQKYAEDGTTPLPGATFTIRKTNELVEDSELTEYITNQNGKIEVTLEAGEYDITETKAPEGYKLPENPTTKITIDRDTTEVVANIVNERIQGTVTVHHYIKGTTTPVLLLDGTEAEDEIKTGNVGSTYITTPRLDIQDGYVYVDSSNNTSGTYIDGNIDIIYYYGIRTDLKYVVNYLEKDTNNVLQEPSIFENQTFGNTIISNEKVISIDGYVYDSLSPETLTISSDNNQNIINIYYVKNEIDLKVTKIWNDSNNKRPEQIKVIVKSNGNQVAETILTADNAKDNSSIWEYTFEKLIKYDNDGKLIDYTLEEQEVNTDDLKFYTVEIGNIIPEIDESGKTTSYTAMITNTFTVPNDTIDIKVNKVWDDNNNINGKRPNSIKLIVSKVKNEEDISEVNQSAMTIDSKVNIKNDTEENNSNTLTRAENIVKETNTTVEEKEDSNLSQNTNDKDLVNSEGLNESNTENSIVDEIVKDEITEESVDGDTIDETKVESKIEEVEKSNEIADKNVEDNNSVMEASEVKEFTNEAEENTSNANLSNDISDEDLLDSLDLITPEKTTIVSTHVLEVSEEEFANNTWEYTFTKLPKYDENGNEIKYVVTEETMLFYEATGGEVVIGTDSEGSTTYTATLTNIFKVPTDTVNITVNKVWVDNVEQMNRRPESIVIKLMNGDKELNQEVITAENNWTSTFAGFAKYDDLGNEINYTVSEESVEFYTPSYSPVTKDGENYSITITNTFTGSNETTQIPVEKVWNDNNKERLSSIILVLTGNGQEYTQTLTENNMSSINTWKYIFTDLPKYDDNGIEIVYTLSEKGVNTGDLDKYIQTVEGYTVTNTLIIKDSEITKTGPATITSLQETMNYTINYKASIDENYTNDATVTIIDTLPYEIDTEKPYNLNGGIYDSKNKTITWTEVMKKPVDITKNISLVYKDVELSDTTATITNNVKGSIELANGVKEEKETSFDTTTNFTKKIILNKVWVGDGEISRPDSITVNLKGLIKGTNEAGEETTIEYTLPEEISKATIKASDNWTYTWNNLPKYDQVTSQEITYSVEEAQIPGYYNSLTEENNIFTLTNYKYGNVLITKVDSKNKAEKLGGAEFKLEKLIEQNGEMVVDTSFIAITQTTSTSEETKGQANFVNLEYGKYRLIETKAPEGYNLLSNPIDIEISNDNTDISLEISNIATTVLPATGGRGINVLTLIGILVIFLAIKLKTTTVKTKKLK